MLEWIIGSALAYHLLMHEDSTELLPDSHYMHVVIKPGCHQRISYARSEDDIDVKFKVFSDELVNVRWISNENYKLYLEGKPFKCFFDRRHNLEYANYGSLSGKRGWNFLIENTGDKEANVSYEVMVR